jgi:type III restriction enzyme
VYDYISGFERETPEGFQIENGRLALFRNFDDFNKPLSRPHTLLIDSSEIESGGELDASFRKAAAAEIEQFRRELVQRSGNQMNADDIEDVEVLREVMNTVGKKGRLGESIRCVVSVSMLTEGWDQYSDARLRRTRLRHSVAMRTGRRARIASDVLRPQ